MKMRFKKPTYGNVVGPDGAGKDTAYEKYISNLLDVVRLREPGGTAEAEKIRSVILDVNEDKRESTLVGLLNDPSVLPITKEYLQNALLLYRKEGITGNVEAQLYAASRAQTNRTLVSPALAEGKSVFGSRSVACSMAYQAYARGLGMEEIWQLNLPALSVLPDFEIYFDVPTDIAMLRLKNRSEKQDRLDQETEDFHRLTREGYLKYYKEYCPYPYYIIDASKTKEEVYEQLELVLSPFVDRIDG